MNSGSNFHARCMFKVFFFLAIFNTTNVINTINVANLTNSANSTNNTTPTVCAGSFVLCKHEAHTLERKSSTWILGFVTCNFFESFQVL